MSELEQSTGLQQIEEEVEEDDDQQLANGSPPTSRSAPSTAIAHNSADAADADEHVIDGDFDYDEEEYGLEQDSTGRATDSRVGSQCRLPSQGGRAALARTPGLNDTMPDDDDDDGGGFSVDGRPSDDSSFDDDDDEHERRSILITEVKEGPSQWEGMEVRHRSGDSEAGVDDEEEDGDDDWDTDLELDAELPVHDPSGRTFYSKICEKLGVVPVSYFARHITDQEIVMRYHGLGPDGTRAIARVLRQIVTCEKLNLSGNWMEGKGGVYMAKTITDNDYITELVLCDNQLGAVGGYHFAKMLENNASLRKLDLAGNGFTDNDAEYFAEALEQNKYLKEFSLSRNHFGAEGGLILGPAIGSNDVLEHLDLSWNQIRQAGAVAVAKGIKENVRLKTCNVSWNGFGDEGGSALADGMAQQESMNELDASGNRFTAHTAFALARALKSNEELRILKLGNNPLTTSGAISLAKALCDSDSSVLTYLDITECPVEYEFLKIVKDIELKRTFSAVHGTVMRSGNTSDDIGKPAVDPTSVRNPLLVLKEHIVVNDIRIIELLKEYDADQSLTVSQNQFVSALENLGVPFTRDELDGIAGKLDKNHDGTIFYGDILENMETTNTDLQNQNGLPHLKLSHNNQEE